MAENIGGDCHCCLPEACCTTKQKKIFLTLGAVLLSVNSAWLNAMEGSTSEARSARFAVGPRGSSMTSAITLRLAFKVSRALVWARAPTISSDLRQNTRETKSLHSFVHRGIGGRIGRTIEK